MLFILWVATLLFFLRVIAQFVQWIHPLTFLPAFAQFHGAVLPYPVLLCIQVILLVCMVWLNARTASGWRPAGSARHWLLGLGAIYFAGMFIRLLVGLFDISELAWFHRPIPSFFHLVLATYVLALGNMAGELKEGKPRD